MNELVQQLSFPVCLAITHASELAPEYRVFAEPTGFPWWVMAVALTVIVTAVITGYAVIRYLRVPALALADDLTLELCRAHGVGLQHRVALDHVARLAGVDDTAALFLSPALFNQALARAGAKKRWRGRRKNSLHEAKRMMFSDDPQR